MPGISSSSGEVPNTIEGMAANAGALIKVRGLKLVDLLGFSIGGTVMRPLTLAEPQLVRGLVLVGAGTRGGEGMDCTHVRLASTAGGLDVEP